MTTTTLAAVAAAADGLSDAAIVAAAAAAAATAAPAAAAAGGDAQPPATSAAAPALSASMALELASLALPSVRDQLTSLATAASASGATEASYRTACLAVASAGQSSAAPLVTAAPDTGVTKPGATQQAAIPAAGDIYAARQKAMAG